MQPDDKDQQQRNPSEQDYKKSFNPFSKKSGKEPPGKARQVADKVVKAGVEKGTEAALTATGAGAAVAKPVAKVAGKLLTIKNAKRTAQAGIGGILVILLMSGVMNSPQQIFSHTKETTTDWSDKFLRESYHLRTARIFANRYFEGGSCDVTASIKCLINAGATEREIALMKREGLLKDGDYGQDGERYTVTTLRYYVNGQERTINSGGELIRLYPRTADLVAKFERSIIDPKAFTFRSPQGVHVLYKFGVIRNNPIGTSTDLEQIVEDFRAQMSTGGNFTAVGPSPSGEINSAISGGASDIDTDDPEAFGNALDETAASLNQNVTGCTKESFMQQMSLLNKIVKAPQLIKYNASVQALLDQDRDSKLEAWEQSSMVANMLSKQGRYNESKEKIYSDSGAYTLITQGDVRDDAKEAMAKYANGIAVDGLDYGDGSCPVSPILGQFLVTPDIDSGVYGTSSADVETMEWLTPHAIMLSSGNIVPDPEDDIEGGYNAGNAFASGASALASYLGRGAGNRAITKDEFDQIDREAPESSQIISSNTSSSTEGNRNPIQSFVASVSAELQHIFAPQVSAKEPYKDKYRGDLCTDYDVKVRLGMWPSWTCDPIMAQLPEHLDSNETDPAANTGAMISGGYIYADNTSITEDVFYGNLPELLAACRARGITNPVECVPKVQVSFTPFSGGPKIFNNNFCDDLSLKSPVDVTDWGDPICNRPGPHSYDFVDGGNRLAKYVNGPTFLEWYATCVIWNHPIITEVDYLSPKYLPGDGTRIYRTPQCSGLGDRAATLRLFQLYVKDHNMADSLENVGTDTLGDDTCSDPIYPNPNKFCALDSGTRTGSMATGASTGAASGGGSSTGGGGSAGGGGTITPATGTDQELAKQILASGRVTGDSRYMAQIRAYANGNFSCHINRTILQLIATAAQSNSLYITSLNRFCTGVLTASGTSSYHYSNSGGHAVDFGTINGTGSTGGTSQDIAFLNSVVGILPSGSGIGQVQCRPSGSVRLPSGIQEFQDTCNHVHIQVPIQ